MLYTVFVSLFIATFAVHLTLFWWIYIYVEYQSKLSHTLQILTVKLPLNRLLWNLILDDFTKNWNHVKFDLDWRVLMTTLHEDICLIWMDVCVHPTFANVSLHSYSVHAYSHLFCTCVHMQTVHTCLVLIMLISSAVALIQWAINTLLHQICRAADMPQCM